MTGRFIFALAIFCMLLGCRHSAAVAEPESGLQDGDIVMIRSYSYNANAIEAVTGSRFTHCGIVFNENGRWIVYEGAGRRGHLPLAEWVKHESSGKPPHWKVYRLENDQKLREPGISQELKRVARRLHATHYDHGFSWDYPAGDEERVYCSELVWKAYKEAAGIELCPLRRIGDYPLNQEALLILNCELCKESRGGMEFLVDEPAVAPGDLVAGGLVAEVKVPDHQGGTKQ